MSEAAPRVALITGAAQGIGFATALKLLARGWTVAIADLDLAAAQAAVASLGESAGRAGAVAIDVGDTEAVARAFAGVAGRWGRLDALVNNAGITEHTPSAAVSDAVWSRLLDIHVGGTLRCCRAAFPALSARGGAIVNLSSVGAHLGRPQRAAYAAAKAGIEGLTRTLAVEWAAQGIRVNAVAPGWTRTRLVDKTLQAGLTRESAVVGHIPLRRFAEPAEIAAAVAFLASEEASYITGQALVVDGGATVNGDF